MRFPSSMWEQKILIKDHRVVIKTNKRCLEEVEISEEGGDFQDAEEKLILQEKIVVKYSTNQLQYLQEKWSFRKMLFQRKTTVLHCKRFVHI